MASEERYDEQDLSRVYAQRFADLEPERREGVWREITRYLQRFVPTSARILEIACGQGAFIRHIVAGERWASDLRDMRQWLPEEVKFVCASGLSLDQQLPHGSFDVIFMSNYLEHLLSRAEVVAQLRVASRLLRPGGRIIILQPNIRLVGGRYWDFVDHHVALTERSLAEAAQLAGFVPERVVVRFLPYSTLGRLPHHWALVRAYLSCPPAWLLLGKQTLYVGRLDRSRTET